MTFARKSAHVSIQHTQPETTLMNTNFARFDNYDLLNIGFSALARPSVVQQSTQDQLRNQIHTFISLDVIKPFASIPQFQH
jgi:hypothetical protein